MKKIVLYAFICVILSGIGLYAIALKTDFTDGSILTAAQLNRITTDLNTELNNFNGSVISPNSIPFSKMKNDNSLTNSVFSSWWTTVDGNKSDASFIKDGGIDISKANSTKWFGYRSSGGLIDFDLTSGIYFKANATQFDTSTNSLKLNTLIADSGLLFVSDKIKVLTDSVTITINGDTLAISDSVMSKIQDIENSLIYYDSPIKILKYQETTGEFSIFTPATSYDTNTAPFLQSSAAGVDTAMVGIDLSAYLPTGTKYIYIRVNGVVYTAPASEGTFGVFAADTFTVLPKENLATTTSLYLDNKYLINYSRGNAGPGLIATGSSISYTPLKINSDKRIHFAFNRVNISEAYAIIYLLGYSK